MSDAICPLCTKWFCEDEECRKRLANRAAQVRWRAENDRTPYYANYYRENRERILERKRLKRVSRLAELTTSGNG